MAITVHLGKSCPSLIFSIVCQLNRKSSKSVFRDLECFFSLPFFLLYTFSVVCEAPTEAWWLKNSRGSSSAPDFSHCSIVREHNVTTPTIRSSVMAYGNECYPNVSFVCCIASAHHLPHLDEQTCIKHESRSPWCNKAVISTLRKLIVSLEGLSSDVLKIV